MRVHHVMHAEETDPFMYATACHVCHFELSSRISQQYQPSVGSRNTCRGGESQGFNDAGAELLSAPPGGFDGLLSGPGSFSGDL